MSQCNSNQWEWGLCVRTGDESSAVQLSLCNRFLDVRTCTPTHANYFYSLTIILSWCADVADGLLYHCTATVCFLFVFLLFCSFSSLHLLSPLILWDRSRFVPFTKVFFNCSCWWKQSAKKSDIDLLDMP